MIATPVLLPRVLIVDDDPALRQQLKFALEEQHEVAEATQAREAIEQLTVFDPDVTILDLGLPPREQLPDEGYRVLEHSLACSAGKMVVLTGQGGEQITHEAIRRGAFDYLLKPAPLEQIVAAVSRALLFLDSERRLYEQGVSRINVDVEMGKGLQSLRDEAGRQLILKVLRDTGFNVYLSAKRLGVKRETLYYFIHKFGIRRPDDA